MTYVESADGKLNLLRCLSFARSYAVIIGSVLILSGCGGGGGADQPASNEGPPSTPSTELPVIGNTVTNTVQDIWLYQRIQVVQIDGSLVDITDSILESLNDDLFDPFPLYGDVTFSLSTKLQPQIVDSRGQLRDHIHVMAGVLSDGDVSALAVIATPDTTSGTLVERNDMLEMDFSSLPINALPGDVILADHYFAVVVIPDDEILPPISNLNALDGGSDAITLSMRQQSRSYHKEIDAEKAVTNLNTMAKGVDDGYGAAQAVVSGQTTKLILAKAVTGGYGAAEKVELPAKAHGMIDGVSGGASECISSPGIFCVGKLFNSQARGFAKSLKAVDSNFPVNNNPPTTQVAAPFDVPRPAEGQPEGRRPKFCVGSCGSVDNDPHITTLDGRHYSPQPVGEMTALSQISNSGIPLEMQWRFGAFRDNEAVSVTTAVAFGFGDTRITLDINRDVLIAVNGEPIELDRFPQEQLESAALGLLLANRSGTIELEYEDWLFSIHVGSEHLNIIASATVETADVTGLLGNFDGNPDNDLMSRDGTTTLGPDATLDALYNVYLNSWRVTDESSLFDYGVGETTATYTDLNYPIFPDGVASSITLASEFSLTRGLDTRRAEGACRRAGITDEPLFGNCVTDYVLSGNTEFIVGQQQALDTARRDRVNRFGEGLNGRDMIWWQIFEGDVFDLPSRKVVSDGRILLVRSRDEERRHVIDAIDGQTGRKLWRLQDTQNECTPTSFGNNLMVLQADGNTEFGGSDNMDDLLLVDSQTGEILDRWQPESSSLRACTAPLQITSDNSLIFVDSKIQRGFSIVNNQFEMLWEHQFSVSNPEFSASSSFNLEPNAIVKGNNLFLVGHKTAVESGKSYTVYQIDTASGVIVDRLTTSLTELTGFFDAGPSHLALVQQLQRLDLPRKILLVKTPTANSSESMGVLWERDNGAIGDPLRRVIGVASAYSNDSSFGVWAVDNNILPVIADIDLLSGDVNALIPASGVQFIDDIVKLESGAYVAAPSLLSTQDIDSLNSMVKGTSADFSTSWSIDRVEGVELPRTLHLLDNDRLVMVVPLTDIINGDILSTEWAVFAMGTQR